MEEKQIHILIQKYLSGTASAEETAIIEKWYLSKQQEDVVWELEDEEITSLKDRMKSSIWDQTVTAQSHNRRNTLFKYIAAAAVLIFAIVLFYNKSQEKEYHSLAVISENQIENRHLLLSDSSVVILRPGSELLISEDFGNKNREVELIGEAYFDVTPNKSKPFIINTADVKTTVLGTAFSIQAHPNSGNIEVLVDHGKVRVENKEEVLGIITADQKLIISDPKEVKTSVKTLKQVSKQELIWKDQDMHFDAMTFGEIVEKLERRYQVSIDFVNMDLEKCKMSGFFQGTEIVEEVLTNLCLTSNTTFKKTADNQYEIDGKSTCN